jgi:hypothetical protein
MGLLSGILGQERNQSKPYVDAGVDLISNLTPIFAAVITVI